MLGVPAKRKLIVGLGNPGEKYEETRHNIGFLIVDAFAKSKGLAFKPEKYARAFFAKGLLEQTEVYLLKPETYMNLSGEAVQQFLKLRDLHVNELLVVLDDADLPFGELRLKAFGSSGGHNGLKSIENLLGTDQFARLRVGIGRSKEYALVDYVLNPFSAEEKEKMPKLFKRAEEALQLFLKETLANAMSRVNAKLAKNEFLGEKNE